MYHLHQMVEVPAQYDGLICGRCVKQIVDVDVCLVASLSVYHHTARVCVVCALLLFFILGLAAIMTERMSQSDLRCRRCTDRSLDAITLCVLAFAELSLPSAICAGKAFSKQNDDNSVGVHANRMALITMMVKWLAGVYSHNKRN